MPEPLTSSAADFRATPPRCAVVHGWLTAEAYAAVLAEARRRRIHVDRLTAHIIDIVARDDLYRAVLGG